MNSKFIKKTLGIALLAAMSLNCTAQDLIAHQAPSDRHLKDVKSVKLLNSSSMNIDLSDPASDIYTDWRNDFVSGVSGHVPANYKVDLRGFYMPTPSRTVTSNFGARWGRQHQGLDIKVYTGDTIRAAFDGKVRITKYDRNGYGYHVVIRHPNGLETLYGHLSKIIAKENQIVHAGDVIGLGGNTGRSLGSHLHFETRILGKAIDPAYMFDFAKQDVTGDFYVIKGTAITKGSVTPKSSKQKEVASTQTEIVNAAPNTDEVAQNTESTPKQDMQEAKATKSSKSQRNQKKQNKATATYKVQNGDTLYGIAKKHGTTVAKLCQLNGIKESGYLHKGQVLKTS